MIEIKNEESADGRFVRFGKKEITTSCIVCDILEKCVIHIQVDEETYKQMNRKTKFSLIIDAEEKSN